MHNQNLLSGMQDGALHGRGGICRHRGRFFRPGRYAFYLPGSVEGEGGHPQVQRFRREVDRVGLQEYQITVKERTW